MRILVRLVNKVAAIALLFGVGLAAYILVAEPVAHHFGTLTERISEQRKLLGRLSAPAMALEPEAARTRTASLQAGRTLFLSGVSDSVRAAELQSHLGRLAKAEGVELRSSRTLSPLERDGLRLLGLEAQLTGELGALQRLLHRIEADRPLLVIDALQILAPPAQETNENSPPRLEARVSILGATLAKDGG